MTASIAKQNNPYIIGVPIHEPKDFFGREDLFKFIEDNLKQNAKVILLHGQRRIGKSSVLCQVHNFVELEEFCFVVLSLEGKSAKSLSEVLHKMAVEIKEYLEDELELEVQHILPPSRKDLEQDRKLFYDNFFNQIFEVIGGKNLVVLLDEFDVLEDNSQDTATTHLFPYLKSLIDKQEKLFLIPVVGRRLDDMPNLLGLFHQAPNQRIGLLEERNAKRLITEPAKGILEYQPDAIKAILELSAGHPYFTQVICFAVFSKARDEEKPLVTREDVESVVDKAIENAEAGLAWFYDGLPIPERVIFSAVAEAQQIAAGRGTFIERDSLKLLQEYGVVLTDSLKQAEERLVEWGFLDNLGKQPELLRTRKPTYTITIELVRRWLIKQHPLHREIWQLEKLDLQPHSLYEQPLKFRDSIDKAIALRPRLLTGFSQTPNVPKASKFSRNYTFLAKRYKEQRLIEQNKKAVGQLVPYNINIETGKDIQINIANTINQLPESNSQEQEIKELLSQLQDAISNETSLEDEDKSDVSEEVKNLQKATQNIDEGKKKTAKKAIRILKGIFISLPTATKVVQNLDKLLEAISKLPGLGG